jgi:hypothetical protein
MAAEASCEHRKTHEAISSSRLKIRPLSCEMVTLCSNAMCPMWDAVRAALYDCFAILSISSTRAETAFTYEIPLCGYAAGSDRRFGDSFLEVRHDTANSLFELFLIIMLFDESTIRGGFVLMNTPWSSEKTNSVALLDSKSGAIDWCASQLMPFVIIMVSNKMKTSRLYMPGSKTPTDWNECMFLS